jgi:hypothetical protein
MVATMNEFLTAVRDTAPVYDEPLTSQLVRFNPSQLRIEIGDHVAETTSLYQIGRIFGVEADFSGLTRQLRAAARLRASPNADRNDRLTVVDTVQRTNDVVGKIVAAMKHKPQRDYTMRVTSLEDGRTIVGGVVSTQYKPITHYDFADMLEAAPAFNRANIVKMDVSSGYLDAMILLDGEEWKVDGGLKTGISIRNGQFGDRSYGFAAMLFRLRCTNGMMTRFAEYGVGGRHTGKKVIDLGADVVVATERATELADMYKLRVKIVIDIAMTLAELVRRGYISRSAARSAFQRVEEVMQGMTVENATKSEWGLAQAIAAAARDYAYGQAGQLSTLSGDIIMHGTRRLIEAKPVPVSAPAATEIIEYFEQG